MRTKTYIKTFVLLNLFLISSVLIANIIIDAQGVVNFMRLDGINKYIVVNNDSGRLSNSVNLHTRQYDIIVTGTSRVQRGIDPRSKAFDGFTVYNASLGDTEVKEQAYELEYIFKKQVNLKHLVFGLDFHTFSLSREIKPQFYDSMFYHQNSYIDVMSNYFLSYQSLKDVYTTVKKNQHNNIDKYWLGGYNHNPRNKEEFQEDLEHILKLYMSDKKMFGCFKYDMHAIEKLEKKFEKFAQKGVKVSLFISPQHAKNFLMLKYLGLFPQYYSWMSELEEMHERINKKYPDSVTLWDFCGFGNEVNTESISPDLKQMKYYFETSHYKDNVGTYIMNAILQGQIDIKNFGTKINQQNIKDYIKGAQIEQENYIKIHPVEVNDLLNLFHATQGKRDSLGCYK